MKIWGIEESTEYPPLVLVSANIWTPIRWSTSRCLGFITHADEALRSLFPNIPEVIEGPWGSLSRSGVLGAEEACGSIMDAVVGLATSEGEKIDPAMALGTYSSSGKSLAERERSGKIRLGGGLSIGSFSMLCQAGSIEIDLPASFYKEDKTRALLKIDKLIDAIETNLSIWIPSLHKVADPSVLAWSDVQCCLAKARVQELCRVTPMPTEPKVRVSRRI